MKADIRDFALTNAAFDHVEMQARIADLEGERDTYADLLKHALAQLHDFDAVIVRERQRRQALADEYASFRERAALGERLPLPASLGKTRHKAVRPNSPPPSMARAPWSSPASDEPRPSV